MFKQFSPRPNYQDRRADFNNKRTNGAQRSRILHAPQSYILPATNQLPWIRVMRNLSAGPGLSAQTLQSMIGRAADIDSFNRQGGDRNFILRILSTEDRNQLLWAFRTNFVQPKLQKMVAEMPGLSRIDVTVPYGFGQKLGYHFSK